MKTVTIPTCANPFVVIINGKKYTYPAGATMEVPDEVAEVIERHEEAKPEPAPVQPPYSGGMNGDEILAAAKAYTDKKCEGAGGGGLPVVELTTIIYSEDLSGVALTADENVALNAAAATGLPAVVKFVLDGEYSAIFSLTKIDESFLYSTVFEGISVALQQQAVDHTWVGLITLIEV